MRASSRDSILIAIRPAAPAPIPGCRAEPGRLPGHLLGPASSQQEAGHCSAQHHLSQAPSQGTEAVQWEGVHWWFGASGACENELQPRRPGVAPVFISLDTSPVSAFLGTKPFFLWEIHLIWLGWGSLSLPHAKRMSVRFKSGAPGGSCRRSWWVVNAGAGLQAAHRCLHCWSRLGEVLGCCAP